MEIYIKLERTSIRASTKSSLVRRRMIYGVDQNALLLGFHELVDICIESTNTYWGAGEPQKKENTRKRQ